MSEGSPVGSGLNKLLSYSFMLLAVAIMLSWAWDLLQPLVPVIVVTVGLVLMVAAVVRVLASRGRSW